MVARPESLADYLHHQLRWFEVNDDVRRMAERLGYANVEFRLGEIEDMPVEDGTVDVAISNCVLNLVPDKRRAIREMYRVLRPGGRVQLADVVIRRPVTVDCDDDPRLWEECVEGATVAELNP